MQNPFESGHIKNYILAYVSVVVIMVLFFIASTLFHDVPSVKTKTFSTQVADTNNSDKNTSNTTPSKSPKFKLLDVTH